MYYFRCIPTLFQIKLKLQTASIMPMYTIHLHWLIKYHFDSQAPSESNIQLTMRFNAMVM